MHITYEQVSKAVTPELDPWAFGNDVLYTLCCQNPTHDRRDVVIAKIWLIGRAYAAAIERRKSNEMLSDNFYTDVVAPQIMASLIDIKIAEIAALEKLEEPHIERILHLHWYLTSIFKQIAGQDKRSLASKYLHFHLPQFFFIYDSRACASLNSIIGKTPRTPKVQGVFDKEYQDFYYKIFKLRTFIHETYDILMNPRQIDRLLLEYYPPLGN